MKQTVSQHDFTEAFRSIRPDNFSYQGLIAMFYWFEDLDDSLDTETELDVIAICCEFSEFENLADFHTQYDKDQYPDIESIQEYTSVIEVDKEFDLDEHERRFIIAEF